MSVLIKGDDVNHIFEVDGSLPLPLRIKEVADSKELTRIIKNIETQVRRSYEYRLWRNYILETVGHKYCALTGEVNDEVTIELHHHPLTLYDIVDILINDHIVKEVPFCTFDISTKVIELHYSNKVGYIPLCKTLHEKYHNGYLNINIDLVYGNWKTLLSEYEETVPEYTNDKIARLSNIKKTQIVNKDKDSKQPSESSTSFIWNSNTYTQKGTQNI